MEYFRLLKIESLTLVLLVLIVGTRSNYHCKVYDIYENCNENQNSKAQCLKTIWEINNIKLTIPLNSSETLLEPQLIYTFALQKQGSKSDLSCFLQQQVSNSNQNYLTQDLSIPLCCGKYQQNITIEDAQFILTEYVWSNFSPEKINDLLAKTQKSVLKVSQSQSSKKENQTLSIGLGVGFGVILLGVVIFMGFKFYKLIKFDDKQKKLQKIEIQPQNNIIAVSAIANQP